MVNKEGGNKLNIKLTQSDLYTIGRQRYMKPRENKGLAIVFGGLLLSALIMLVVASNIPEANIYYQTDSDNEISIEYHQDYIVIDNQTYLTEDTSVFGEYSNMWIVIYPPAILGILYLFYLYWKGDQEGRKFRNENTIVKQ